MGKISKALERSNQANGQNTDTRPSEPPVRKVERQGTKDPTTFPLQRNADPAEMLENEKWDLRLRISTDPHLPYFEQFRRLRTSILYPSTGKRPRTVLVTSVAPNEGKGFVCASLGVAIAQDMEHHALMLDCDFRKPTLASLFAISNETGLVDYLEDDVDLSLLIRKTGQPKLSLIASGKPPENPAEMITSRRMNRLIQEVAERYDDRVVLFDSPPNIFASETGILAKQLDSVVLVVRHGFSKKAHVKKFVDAVGPEKILGLVYNAYPENMLEKIIDGKMGYGYEYGKYY